MNTTVGKLAEKVGGTPQKGRENEVLKGVASIADAGEGDLTFFSNRRYLAQLKKSAASAALVPIDFDEEIPAALIKVENPSVVFAEVLKEVAPPEIRYAPGIHPTAVVHPAAKVSETASIQPHAVIEEGASIGERSVIGAGSFVGTDSTVGDDCLIYPNVSIRERISIGNRAIIHCGAVIGSDGYGFEFREGKHEKIPQIGTVQIDDDVEIGANTTIDRARFGRTWIQEGTKIDNLVQVAHNVVVGRHNLLVAQVGMAGSTKLGNYVTLAGQVGVAGHIEIGDKVIAAAQSGIANYVPPGTELFATPAVPMKEARKQIAALHRLPAMREEINKLKQQISELEKQVGEGNG